MNTKCLLHSALIVVLSAVAIPSTSAAQNGAPDLVFTAPIADKNSKVDEWIAAGTDARFSGLKKKLRDLDTATRTERERLMVEFIEAQKAYAIESVQKWNLSNAVDVELLKRYSDLLVTTTPSDAPRWLIGVVKNSTDSTNVTDGSFPIASVRAGSAAEKAGLRAGDVIRSCNGITLKNPASLSALIVAAEDQELTLTVNRDGEDGPLQIRVVPERNKDVEPKISWTAPKPNQGKGWHTIKPWFVNPTHVSNGIYDFNPLLLSVPPEAIRFFTNQNEQPLTFVPNSSQLQIKQLNKALSDLRKIVDELQGEKKPRAKN
jgi:hypothetical protein